MSTLVDLLKFGQSYWLDNLTRGKIKSGEIKKRVEEQGLRGITSNPAIFHKAITSGIEYDEQIIDLVNKGLSPVEIYDALTIKDVQDACDLLEPVFESSGGKDGFVSLEVSPYLARDTEGSINEAWRLYKAVNRPNCLIKIPGTKEGILAIEQLLFEGINVNVTLLFSITRYEEIAHAYLRSVKRRVAEGLPVSHIISVASFFLSRIDVLTDQLISQYLIEGNGASKLLPQLLFGKAGIASAKLAYRRFKEIFGGDDWTSMGNYGANRQRLLWASTGNKDPLYKELRYVDALIGPDTVNTLPDATIEAYCLNGKPESDTLEKDIEESVRVITGLHEMGIDLELITWQLEQEGIRKFVEPYDQLIGTLAEKRLKILASKVSIQEINPGRLKNEIAAAYMAVNEKQAGNRLFRKDPYLWKTEPTQAKMIAGSMGWINLPGASAHIIETLTSFSLIIKKEGYKHVLLLGMGGSSLCSEVARQTFKGNKGFPDLLVLDNTDPTAILDIESLIDINHTLFIVATKSGGTKETLSFFRYFYSRLQSQGKENPGNDFIAVTDQGSPLVKIAADFKFRRTFINPGGIGGRYSVLSDFGLLPMAMMGIDISELMASAWQMEQSCDGSIPPINNPGINLGVVLGVCFIHGINKVTFVLSSSIRSFGLWAEQLIAESTGKEGKGLVPVNGETLGSPYVYGKDRLFVQMALAGDKVDEDDQKLGLLEAAGHPVVRIRIANKMALGGEYYRWEIAVAMAGMIMGINPYDQPNVEESKKNTANLLIDWKKEGKFKAAEPIYAKNEISIYGSSVVKELADKEFDEPGDFMTAFTGLAQPGDYIAILPYFPMTDFRTEKLNKWRIDLRDQLKVATTLLNGPRYLHSTGQLHKGGPDTGLYIILTSIEKTDLEIPDEQFGFSILHEAQSLGDFRSLDDKGRRVVRINLGKDIDKGLDNLIDSIMASENSLKYLLV